MNDIFRDRLVELVSTSEFVHLSRIEDDEDASASRILLSFRRDNKRHVLSGKTLEEVICPRRKRCSRCRQTKTLSEFPRAPVRRDRPEGLHSHCKVCDRLRKRGKYPRRHILSADEPLAPTA